MKSSTLKRNFSLIAILGVLGIAEKSGAQTLISLTNYNVTTPGEQFKFDVNGVDSGQPQDDGNVDDSVNFSLNAGATYIFAMNTTAGFHPVNICTAPNTTSTYSGASVQGGSGGTVVKLTIPATNFPSTLYYICAIHQFYGTITVNPPQPPPPATIVKTTVSSNIVLTFKGGTNTIPVTPQFSSNLVGHVWLNVPSYTNTFPASGTNTITFGRLDAVCGPNVFLRISQAPN